MKINLDIETKPEEIIDLIAGLTNPLEPNFAHAEERSYPEGAKPSSGSRGMMRTIYRAKMAKGQKPTHPMRGLSWEDYFDPHELDDNGPILELFVTPKEIAYNKKKGAAKRLVQRKS